MGRRKRKGLEPEYIETEPISLVLSEFLGRRIRGNKEGEQQKVDIVEKEVDSPVEAVLSKKVGKKKKKSKKRVSFVDNKSKEVEQEIIKVQITELETKHGEVKKSGMKRRTRSKKKAKRQWAKYFVGDETTQKEDVKENVMVNEVQEMAEEKEEKEKVHE